MGWQSPTTSMQNHKAQCPQLSYHMRNLIKWNMNPSIATQTTMQTQICDRISPTPTFASTACICKQTLENCVCDPKRCAAMSPQCSDKRNMISTVTAVRLLCDNTVLRIPFRVSQSVSVCLCLSFNMIMHIVASVNRFGHAELCSRQQSAANTSDNIETQPQTAGCWLRTA